VGGDVASILVGYLAAGAFYVLRELGSPRVGSTRLLTDRPAHVIAIVWASWPMICAAAAAQSAIAHGWRKAAYLVLVDGGPSAAILLAPVAITLAR
jgi:hypothetical protein